MFPGHGVVGIASFHGGSRSPCSSHGLLQQNIRSGTFVYIVVSKSHSAISALCNGLACILVMFVARLGTHRNKSSCLFKFHALVHSRNPFSIYHRQ